MSHVRKFDPVGAAESAALLGISDARFRELKDGHPLFPKPAKTLAMGLLYDADEIRAFDRVRKRRPGRPRKEPAAS